MTGDPEEFDREEAEFIPRALPLGFRAGHVAVVGRPNVGKSTLINQLLGQKIAAVSPKPQTTRRQQLGILTLENAQLVLIDTPGMHNPAHKLGVYMNEVATQTLEESDLVLWLVDASAPPHRDDRLIAERLNAVKKLPPLILALNKLDRVSAGEIEPREAAFRELAQQAEVLWVSALNGTGTRELLAAMTARLPLGAPIYSPDMVTDAYERDIAAELIREAALLHLRDEVPHGVAVRIDEFTERGEAGAYIAATLFVERDSQKGIVIGQKGSMLKEIGSTARREIESMSGRKVYLELRVKVNKNWRDNPEALRRMGYVKDKK